ncbi:MAG: bifunctional methylenetetrahydrofolate dehydrogenase/methenyltetrahydrofolate cyclohydrolase FolD [Alphaproteobacteria bacterium]|nr:bifunctional methylenetetrahydrofolate dehydrogenase/methenyltetrahydrofolate cyclohydrolase FolD [Alphaproteobacteria bacterium]
MSAQIINGKDAAAIIRADLKNKISSNNYNETPCLAVILVGDNDASKIYVRNKQKAAEEVGIKCNIIELSPSIGENALTEIINELNNDNHTHGIIVQLPLPDHLNQLKILSLINPAKDVDGFTPFNNGLLAYNSPETLISATPKGILNLLKSTNIDLSGKHAVIIGRSNIVGKPLSMLLLNNDCTVSVTHSKTQNIESIVKMADIVITACGQAKMVKSSWIKKGAIVIDVGINRQDGKLCGDVDFDDVKDNASFITPVPGGVGPMTVAMLLANTYEAFCKQLQNCDSCKCNKNNCHCH